MGLLQPKLKESSSYGAFLLSTAGRAPAPLPPIQHRDLTKLRSPPWDAQGDTKTQVTIYIKVSGGGRRDYKARENMEAKAPALHAVKQDLIL